MTRFVLLALLIWVVWYIARHDLRQQFSQRTIRRTARADAAVDTIKCQQCGAYVAATLESTCSRGDCPFPVIKSG